MVRLLVPLLVVTSLTSGCSSLPARSTEDLAQVVATTDWKRMEDVTLMLRDYGLTPGELRFKVGQPYRLTIVNSGINNHYFNAPEFFRTIAVRKAEVPSFAEIKAPVFTTFEIFAAGGHIDIWFVPLEKGRYRAYCHLGNHAEMGVEATLVVE